MEGYFIKKGWAYFPADQETLEKVKKASKDVTKMTFTKARNYKFLQKYMVLTRIGHDNTKLDMPLKAYRHLMQIKAGYANFYRTDKGVYIEAKSISFDSMAEEEFEELYSRVLDEIIKDIGADREFIEKELGGFL